MGFAGCAAACGSIACSGGLVVEQAEMTSTAVTAATTDFDMVTNPRDGFASDAPTLQERAFS
jgi:hypothetical protein